MARKIKINERQLNDILNILSENANINNVLQNLKPNESIKIIDNNDNEMVLNIISFNNNEFKAKDENNSEVTFKKDSFNDVTKEFTIKVLNRTTNAFIDKKYVVKDIVLNNDNEPESDKSDDGESDINNELFNDYYKEVVNNPELRKAFYKAPSLWNYFTAAMQNKKARGSGIYPAYQIISNFFNDRINRKLPGFTDKENKRATFYLTDDIEIPYYTLKDYKNRKIFRLDRGYRKATVTQYEAGLGDVKVLSYRSSGGNYGYKIAVKKPTGNKPDEYFCDIYVNINNVEKNKFVLEDVILKFINSDGYQSNVKTK
jgi:hypothetical protein